MDVYVELKASISDYLAKMRLVRSTMDDTSKSADTLGSKAQVSSSGMSMLTKSALAVAPALAPIGTVVAGLGVGLLGMGVAGVAGMGALALAAGPLIGNMNTAATAQQKYNNTVTAFGPNSTQAKAAMKQLTMAQQELTPAARAAASNLSSFKDQMQSWQQSFEPQLLPLFATGLTLAGQGLMLLSPVVKGAAQGLQAMGQSFSALASNPATTKFFGVLGGEVKTIFAALGPVIANLLTGVMHFVQAASPLINIVVGLIGQVAKAFAGINFAAVLGPLVTNFQKLAPIVGQFLLSLVKVIGGILTAIAPIGVAMFTVISAAVTAILPIVKTLGGVIAAVAPVIALVAQAFAGVLGAAIAGIAPIIQSLLPVISEVVKLLGGGLIGIFKAIQPAIVAVLPVVGQFISALVKALGPAIKTLIPALVALAGTLIADLLPVIKDLVPILPQIAALMGVALAGAVQILLPLIQSLTPILNVLIPVLAAVLIPTLQFLVSALKLVPGPILAVAAALLIFDVNPIVLGIGLIIVGIFELIKHWSAIWGEIKRLTADAVNFVKAHWKDMVEVLLIIVTGGIGLIPALILRYWKQISDFTSNLYRDVTGWVSRMRTDVVTFFTRMWTDVTSWVSRLWHDVFTFFQRIWNDSTAWIRRLHDDLIALWVRIYNDTIAKIVTLVTDVATWFEGLPTRILAALFGLGAQMVQFGKDIINDLISGITSVVPHLLDIVGNFASGILGKLGSLFGIKSPSSKMFDMGKNLMQGLADGITAHGNRAAAAAAAAAQATGAAVSGNLAANQALGQQMAAGMGWTGAEWLALNQVEMDEAGWDPTAKNKQSNAYGIAQFINGPGEYAQYGGNATTVAGQITGFLNYVKARYGDPLAALAHENAYHWYDQGGILPPGLTMAVNATGRDEYISRTPGGGGNVTVNVTVLGTVVTPDGLASSLIEPIRRAINGGAARNSTRVFQ